MQNQRCNNDLDTSDLDHNSLRAEPAELTAYRARWRADLKRQPLDRKMAEQLGSYKPKQITK